MSDNPEALIGHNIGKYEIVPTVDKLVDDLTVANADALARVEEIVQKGAKYFVIENDEQDDAATQFLVGVRARYKQSEADRVAAVTPWDDLRGAAHAFFKGKILDVIGLGPAKANESFDPVTATQYGVGPRINMAQTLYKRVKAEKERLAREAEAARLRKIEEDARREREEAERKRRAEEDRVRAEAAKAAAEARRKAEEEAAAAARKRNEANKAAAEEAAAAARKAAAEAEERQRLEDERIAMERAQRDEEARREENRLAEERAAAEAAASAPLADMSRARGEKGGVSSLRQFVNWRDINRETLNYSALGPYFKDAAIEAALKGFADANKATVETGIKTGNQPIRGVVFFLDSKNAGRA
jgi:hypothetical protein